MHQTTFPSCLQIQASDFCTVDNVLIDVDFDRAVWNLSLTRGYTGHHGLAVSLGRDILFKNWQASKGPPAGRRGRPRSRQTM